MLLTSAVADAVHQSQGVAMSLGNGATALGTSVGALGVLRVADVTSISAGLVVAAAVALGTAALLVAGRSRALLDGTARPALAGSATISTQPVEAVFKD
jgi:hypothetical protein